MSQKALAEPAPRDGQRWLRRERTSLAVEHILDAAAEVFTSDGVGNASVELIARQAGCSRATVYRYFPNREAIRTAFLNRQALAIAGRVSEGLAGETDPERLLTGSVRLIIDEVRACPGLAAWFAPADAGIASEASVRSEVVDALMATFVGRLGIDAGRDPGRADRTGRWLLRVIVSLLSMPAVDRAEEDGIIAEFVVPSVVAGPVVVASSGDRGDRS
jgi:AcrR family transcriptional regulator